MFRICLAHTWHTMQTWHLRLVPMPNTSRSPQSWFTVWWQVLYVVHAKHVRSNTSNATLTGKTSVLSIESIQVLLLSQSHWLLNRLLSFKGWLYRFEDGWEVQYCIKVHDSIKEVKVVCHFFYIISVFGVRIVSRFLSSQINLTKNSVSWIIMNNTIIHDTCS